MKLSDLEIGDKFIRRPKEGADKEELWTVHKKKIVCDTVIVEGVHPRFSSNIFNGDTDVIKLF